MKTKIWNKYTILISAILLFIGSILYSNTGYSEWLFLGFPGAFYIAAIALVGSLKLVGAVTLFFKGLWKLIFHGLKRLF